MPKIKPYLFQHYLDNTAEKYPTKEFLKQGSVSLSFSEVREQACALGAGLQKLSLKKGDRIGIWMDKCPEQVIAILGTLYADCVFVVISPLLHHDQALHIIRDCTIQVLLTHSRKKDLITDTLKTTEIKHTFCIDIQNEFAKLISTHTNAIPQSIAISADMSNIIYTSGSTGRPKGIVLSHRNLIDGALIISEYLGLSEKDRILSILPFNFDYGLNQLLTAIVQGAGLVLHTFFLPNDLLTLLEKEQITGLAGIPPIWNAIFNSKLVGNKQYDLSRLRYITNSGGKVPVQTVKNMRAFFPNTSIFLMYGLTEAFRSTFLPPAELDRRPNSIGKAIPNVEVFVINAHGEECKPHEEGELIHRGACIAKGYWNDPEKTAQVYRPNPLLKENRHLETVVYSGDLVYRDEDGFLYFVSRKDDMIKTQGYRVSPTEVEEVILKYKGVQDVIVFGVEDDTLGQKIRALICTTELITAPDITNHCKQEAPSYMVPQEIFFYTQFPKTASGKIDRSGLKKESLAKKEG